MVILGIDYNESTIHSLEDFLSDTAMTDKEWKGALTLRSIINFSEIPTIPINTLKVNKEKIEPIIDLIKFKIDVLEKSIDLSDEDESEVLKKLYQHKKYTELLLCVSAIYDSIAD